MPVLARRTHPVRRARPWLRGLRAMLRAQRARRDLARLDPHLLDDVGLTAEEALRESRRPVWDVPRTWLR